MTNIQIKMYKALLGARDILQTVEPDAKVRRALKRVNEAIEEYRNDFNR